MVRAIQARVVERGTALADGLTLATDKFPSSAAFEAINEALNSSEADKKDAIKQGNGIYAFTLKNAAGETDSWHIDLKNEGKVNKGLAEKADGRSCYVQLRKSIY